MPTFDDLNNVQQKLVRKALAGSVFIADANATPITAMTSGATAQLTALPQKAPGPPVVPWYTDLGYLTKDDGVTWARETEMSEVTAFGALESVRSDINADVTSVQVTALETNKRTIELYENVSLTGVTPTATTGEVSFAKPTRPTTRYYRLFALCTDGAGDDEVFIGKFLPRVQVSEVGDQVWSDADQAITYPLTFTAKTDGDLGYAVRYFFGGPGWKSLLVSMGFPAAT